MDSPSPARQLLRLAMLVTAGLGSLGLIATVGLLRAHDVDGFRLDHAGWQVTATQVVAGGVGALVLVTCSLWFPRGYAGAVGLTRHARAAVVAALVPGVALAVGSGLGVQAAARYASDHSAAAAEAQATADQERALYRLSPTFHSRNGAPAAALGPLLLSPHDLGAGWYDVQIPNPRQLPAGTALDQATGSYTKAHWTGSSWQPELMLSETVATLASPAQARSYAAARSETFARGLPKVTHATRAVAGVPVFVTSGSYTAASFAIGTHALFLRLITWAHPAPGVSTGTDADPAVLDRLIRAAVLRAEGT